MVLGPDDGRALIQELNDKGQDLDALFIIAGSDGELETWISPGWVKEITLLD
jgi:hypothetical protein